MINLLVKEALPAQVGYDLRMAALQFEIQKMDASSHARVGLVTTKHGSFATPAFMPVGTQGTVKGVLPSQLRDINAQIILGNTYHLMLRPGSELIAEMGGLQKWTRWQGPMLTDSGGFQVFSLSDNNKMSEEGVTFKSHLDGSWVQLTPERSMQVQNELGADIIMAFDDCPPAQGFKQDKKQDQTQESKKNQEQPRHAVAANEYHQRVKEACERTQRWLERCAKAHVRTDEQSLFGIVQGGTDLQQRAWCAERVTQLDLPGYAIGGVAVGEGFEGLKKVVEYTAPLLPTNRPRYLMGVGYERDILTAVRAGVDMFDCVLPTRNARNANVFTPTGQIRLRNAKFARDTCVIDPQCDCLACATGSGFTRSYLRHLVMAGEMLGSILLTQHNLRHFQRFLLDIRTAIADNAWPLLAERWPVAFEPPKPRL